MADPVTGLVRVLHLISAASWLGGAFLWSMVVTPRIFRTGPPPIRRPFAEATIPAVTVFFRFAGGLTLASGILLVGLIWGWGNYFDSFQAPTYGPSLAIGALAGIGMAIVGFGIVSPTALKMLKFMQSMNGPPTPEQQAQLAESGKKLGIMSLVTIVLGTIAILGMTWAVNVVR